MMESVESAESASSGTSPSASPGSSSTDLYQQLPLQDPLEIRILTLHATANAPDPLRCELHVNTLADHPPSYNALSYVWGAPHRTCALECNGHQLLITETLDRALRRMRHTTLPTSLWVDQICINQDDLEERTRQVRIMRRVFARATKVTSWLGPDVQEQGAMAADLIQKLVSTYYDHEKQPQSEITAPHFPSSVQLEKLGLPGRNSPEWAAFEALLQHEYFERTWVLQEVRVGCNVNLLWGDTSIKWADVSAAYIQGTRYWMHMRDPDQSGAEAEECSPVLSLERLEAFMTSSIRWIELLRATRRLKASDPRDKVFALAGLVEDDLGLVSDYNSTLGEVYAGAAKQMIESSGNLQTLAYVWIRNLEELRGVPTWAPRWDDLADVNNTPKVLADWADYTASGQSRAVSEETDDWEVLRLKGVILDTVESLATPLDSWDDLESSWWRVVAESWRLARETQSLPGIDLIQSLACTTTAGQTIGINGLTRAAKGPQHLEDFIAFAVNGILQNWPVDGKQVCLRDLIELVDAALESLDVASTAQSDDDGSSGQSDEDDLASGTASSDDGIQLFEDERSDFRLCDDNDKITLSHRTANNHGLTNRTDVVVHQPGDADKPDDRAQDKGEPPDKSQTDEDSNYHPSISQQEHDETAREDSGHDENETNENLSEGSHSEEIYPRKKPKQKGPIEDRDPLQTIPATDIRRARERNINESTFISSQQIDDILASFHSSNPSAAQAAANILRRALENYETSPVIRFASQFEVSSMNRRYYMTSKKKYMGLGPSYTQEGDVVCILFGGSTPYILRPSKNREGEYLFLGESYVHGMMDGEAMHMLAKGELRSQWFNLR